MRKNDLNIWLNDADLRSMSDRLKIIDIAEDAPETTIGTERGGISYGQIVTDEHRENLSVTVRFLLLIHDPAQRMSIIDSIRGWCRDSGYLKISVRPGKMLAVRCTELPAPTGLALSTEYSIVFTAYALPFWVDESPAIASVEGNGSTTMFVGGTAAETTCEISLHNTGTTTINEVSVRSGTSFLTFEDLSLGAGGTLKIDYSVDGNIQINTFSASGLMVSAYSKRTTDSSDDLTVSCGGTNTITVQTDGTSQTTIMARGRWL